MDAWIEHLGEEECLRDGGREGGREALEGETQECLSQAQLSRLVAILISPR
jgi:hypothetical protein